MLTKLKLTPFHAKMQRLSAFSLITVLTALILRCTAGSGLVDQPIVGDRLQYLDSSAGVKWQLHGAGLDITPSVPGDLITDLQAAKVNHLPADMFG